jgi:hypothetical protein
MKTNRKQPWMTLVVASFALATLIGGCKKDDFYEIVGVCPVVESTNPINNAIDVPLNQIVTATFNEEMNPTTITQSSFILTGDLKSAVPVSGTLSYNNTNATLSFVPAGLLVQNTTYTATVKSSVKDLNGNALQTDYVWTFMTGTMGLGPVVITTDPLNNATSVALNKVITATFNMSMDPATITTSTFTLRQGTSSVPGVVTYSGTTASFTPSGNLLVEQTYTATITTGAKSADGFALAADYVWNFSTGTAGPIPVVISTDPMDNATGVDLNKVITATFNMPMDPTTITTATFTLRQGTSPIPGFVTYNGTTASFTPSGDLLTGTDYTATITTGALSEGGIPLAADYVWNFSTGSVVVPPIDLGTASAFGSFGGNAGITNQGINTVINGSIGTTAASTLVTGFHDGLTGDIYSETPLNVGLVTNGIFTAPPLPGTPTSEAIATLALLHANDAYISISPASMPGGIDPGAGELGGLTLAPGIYKSASGTFNISNFDLTLDAQGDPNATWVFQTAAGLTVGVAGPTGARSVILINGALPKNVFWYVGSAATINGAGGGTMVGTIISTAGVTLSTPGNAVQTVLNGRAISLVASVTMVNTTINVPAP